MRRPPNPIARCVLCALMMLAACSTSGEGGEAGGDGDGDHADAATDPSQTPGDGDGSGDGDGDGGGDGNGDGDGDGDGAGDGDGDGDAADAAMPREPSGCKRGVAYGHHSEADMRALSPSVTWWYNWAHVPDSGVRAGAYRTLGVEYVPMVWGGVFDVEQLVAEIPGEAGWLLGFNEPNFGSQANLSAMRAAELWPQLEEIAQRRDLSLASPAVNYCGGDCQDTDPFNYLHTFLDACQGCQVDAIAFHVYVGCNAQWLIDHVSRYKAEFDGPLWLTEFACDSAASMEEQRQFMQDALTYLESEPRIERYAWFAGRADNVPYVDLLGDSGELTILGETYVNHPHNADCDL